MIEENGLEFQELDHERRVLLLKAFDIDIANLRCYYCGEFTSIDKCCIIPNLNKEIKHPTILCNNPLCISQYMGDRKRLK